MNIIEHLLTIHYQNDSDFKAWLKKEKKKFDLFNLLTFCKTDNKITEIEYQRARHAVSEIARVVAAVEVLASKDFVSLGKLLNASHLSLRDDYDVSCPELNCAVEAAKSAGALGARMVGGGFGGSAIALIQVARKSETIAAIEKAGGKVELKKAEKAEDNK